jgi:hypothetical protein
MEQRLRAPESTWNPVIFRALPARAYRPFGRATAPIPAESTQLDAAFSSYISR